MTSTTSLDQLWDEPDAPRPQGSNPDRENRPDGKDILAVVKEWKVVEGKYGPQLTIKVHYPDLVGSKQYWSEETIYLSFPDPNDENDKRRNARKGAIKDWVKGLQVKVSGFSDLGNPQPSPVGSAIRLDKVTNGKFRNMYFRKLVEKASAPKAEPTTDSSVPF